MNLPNLSNLKLPNLDALKSLASVVGLKSVGCVLRARTVEVYEAQRSLQGLQLTKLIAVPIVHPEREGQVAEALSRALNEAGVKSRRLGVSVATPDVLLRAFTLPSLPRAEWATAVQFEARKHIPFKTEDLVWDYYVTEQRSSKQLEVVFMGIRLDTFARIQVALKAADITPSFIEPQAVSLARWMMHSPRAKSSQFYGLVDVEEQSAHIVLTKDQVPYFTRDVSFHQAGGIVGTGLGLGQGFGTIVRETQGPAELTGAEPGAPDPRAEMLLSELRLSLDFFIRENPSSLIGRLWLFGNETLAVSWSPWLTRQLGYPVEPGRLPMPGSGQLANLSFACAAGAAFRDLPGVRVKMNLKSASPAVAGAAKPQAKPAETGLRGQLHPLIKPAVVQLVVALVFLGALKMMGDQQVAAVRRRNQAIVRNFPDPGFRLPGKNRQALLALQKDLDRRLSFLRKMVQDRVSAAEQLETLAKSLPDGIWLEGINYVSRSESDRGTSQAKLVIQGACYLQEADRELGAIRDFAKRLKDAEGPMAQFTSADVGEIMSTVDRTTQAAYKRFRLDCGLGKLTKPVKQAGS